MPECSNFKANMEMCNCTYPCSKKGYCCECVAYHRKRGELPACYFDNVTEATYDRTVERYMRSRGK